MVKLNCLIELKSYEIFNIAGICFCRPVSSEMMDGEGSSLPENLTMTNVKSIIYASIYISIYLSM